MPIFKKKSHTASNPIKSLFDSVKGEVNTEPMTLEEISKSSSNLREIEDLAKRTGQVGLQNLIESQKYFNERWEQKLIPAGFNLSIDAKKLEQVVNNAKKSKELEPLLMTTLKEYSHPIPLANSKRIEQAKDLFDDIYILYTDYSGVDRNVDKDIQKEKDPIALGVLMHQTETAKGFRRDTPDNRLVFITDWVDEYCDLTLDKLAKVYKVPVTDMGTK